MRASREFKSKRGGFTLVEILVVLAIIAVLAGLVAAGVFALIGSQRRTNTQNTMRAVYKALSRQMKSVVDKADQETIPASVLSLAGNDAKRARVIWKKLRLKQEFPMTFAEALYPYNTFASSFVPVNPPPPANPSTSPWGWVATATPPSWAIPTPAAPPGSPLLPTDLPPLPAYVKALQNIAPANTAAQPFLESSTLILLALQQNRGGVVLLPDQLGSYALDVNNDGLKEVIDGWGNPIAFFRFPTNTTLDNTNPAAAGTTAATFRDPYDPEGTLFVNVWNNSNNSGAVNGFENLCHPVHDPSLNTPLAWYILPTLVSAGPDGRWGLKNMFGTYVGLNPDMSIIDNTNSTDTNYPPIPSQPNNASQSADNIYSYLLNLDN